jgi:hypothetical protein
MSKQKGTDYTKLLLIGAALVVVIRYAAAFTASDMGAIEGNASTVTTWFMAASGIGMGFLVVFGQAYAFDGWKRSMPKVGQRIGWRFSLLTLTCLLLIVVDVAILVPFTVSRIRHASISAVLGEWDWLWSVSVNIAPALLLAGVALGNTVVSVTQSTTHGTANEHANEGANRSQGVAARSYGSLSNSEKYYILNSKSGVVSAELGVTPRAVQKWRKRIQEEMSQGKL